MSPKSWSSRSRRCSSKPPLRCLPSSSSPASWRLIEHRWPGAAAQVHLGPRRPSRLAPFRAPGRLTCHPRSCKARPRPHGRVHPFSLPLPPWPYYHLSLSPTDGVWQRAPFTRPHTGISGNSFARTSCPLALRTSRPHRQSSPIDLWSSFSRTLYF